MSRRILLDAVLVAAILLNGVLYALASGTDVFWRVDRGAGEVTFVLMTLTVVLGIARGARPVVSVLHGDVAIVTVAFGALHVVSTILGEHTSLGPLDAVVPFTAAYREPWVGIGVLSAYLYVAVTLTSWPLRRFPRRWWTWLHRSIYAGWGLALAHALGSGTDASSGIYIALDVIAVCAVAGTFSAMRMRRRVAPPPQKSSVS